MPVDQGSSGYPIEGAALVHGVHLAVACGLDVKPVAKQDLLPVFVRMPPACHTADGPTQEPLSCIPPYTL